MVNLNELENVVDIIRLFFIIIYTYLIEIKIINKKFIYKEQISTLLIFLILPIILKIIKDRCGYAYCMICIIILLGIMIKNNMKNNIGHSILIATISLSINYILYFISIALSFLPNVIMNIDNDFISLFIIILIYSILIYLFCRIKKFKRGFTFLKQKLANEYTDIIVLNISIIILFCVIFLEDYTKIITGKIGFGTLIFAIIMFITIQKSLQLYYKQQLQQREIEEMKKEIKQKDEEISKLEQENLNFSKTSHSIAHKQKSLEHKLNQLIMQNETAEEIDIKDRINNIQSELNKNTIVQLKETGIEQIDDMLKYMQSECTKNKIDFDLKINGNIHHMTNKYVEKETLEILLADLVKNAIIAINYSKNINKSILVKLGIIDGIYSIYVYDSGIEFEINTLINLGKKPSTTHADSGGTGMGFMNTFDSLNKYNASIQINEIGKESKDNYTKYIAIKFDNKHEFKINSYRKEEIEKLNNNKDIILENKN